MAGQEHCRLSVSDVYETAVAIGREFQQTIDLYGAATVDKLLPQVQRALEQLEMLAEASENSNLEMGEMRLEIDSLTSELDKEKMKRNVGDEEVTEVIERLERENESLRSKLDGLGAAYEERADEEQTDTETAVLDDDGAAAREVEESLRKLNLSLMGSADELKFKDREIAQRNQDVLALESQIKRLTSVNQNLRKEVALVKARYKILNEAKAAVELQLEVATQAAAKAEEQLQLREKELQERAETNEVTISNGDNEGKASGASEKDEIEEDEANRPRFTLEELRRVLIKRNEWQMKAEDLQEEVTRLKQRFSPDVDIEWPDNEDGWGKREVLKEPGSSPGRRRTSTSGSQKDGHDKAAWMATESMEMKSLSDHEAQQLDQTDGKESGVKQIFQTVGKAGLKSDIT